MNDIYIDDDVSQSNWKKFMCRKNNNTKLPIFSFFYKNFVDNHDHPLGIKNRIKIKVSFFFNNII